MKINSRVFQKRFVVSILVSLIVPMGVLECCFLSQNNGNLIAMEFEMGNYFLANAKFPKISPITSLSVKSNEKKYVEYYQSDFTTGSNKDTIDAVVVFNDDVDWNFPDLTIVFIRFYSSYIWVQIPSRLPIFI